MDLRINWVGTLIALLCGSNLALSQTKSIQDKVFEASEGLLEFLKEDNKKQGIRAVPQRYPLNPELRRDISQALQEIPEVVLNKVESNFEGIYLVKDLGGSGYTEYTLDKSGKIATVFIVLDADTLNRSANEWVTWKENTPFVSNPDFKLTAKIAAPESDIRQGALQFILLHELAHVIGLQRGIHPPWGKLGEKTSSASYPFFDLSWITRQGKMSKKIEQALPGQLVYYFDAKGKPTTKMLPKFYDWLERTNFPTLYSSTNPYDDFAESFATYVHTKLLGKPYEITLEEKGKKKRTLQACWGQPRCADKEKYLIQLLNP